MTLCLPRRRHVWSGTVRDGRRERVGSITLASSDVTVERIDKRDPNGELVPSLHDVSCMVLGETGSGKSTFAKSRLVRRDYDGAVIARALSEASQENEFVEFFEERGQEVLVISSRDSTHRWEPLADYGQSLRALKRYREGSSRLVMLSRPAGRIQRNRC